MLSNELAKRLIKLPKAIEGGTQTISMLDEKSRFILSNHDEPEFEFLFEITSHRKITFKISLHHQEHNLREGLIRIDYKGGHKNPENITDDVPEFVRPYTGYFFVNEPHIHIYVFGFKDLAWAVPLAAYNFPVLTIENSDDLSKAINAFAREINIITPFYIQNSLL
ncbi:hypothetical protein LZG74_02715 [Dyadobacter sp. CY327]|uniref:DUF6978 family protein n=1 Tax=Dyadobacter sp. CY327 TaxID=2907301 RepID=UPI001F2D7031|nr:hypothetical protein [Dyadobacter sp. CY327]MCE7069193.1 hypothetical protein [Dyadobacter sp. CY327]